MGKKCHCITYLRHVCCLEHHTLSRYGYRTLIGSDNFKLMQNALHRLSAGAHNRHFIANNTCFARAKKYPAKAGYFAY